MLKHLLNEFITDSKTFRLSINKKGRFLPNLALNTILVAISFTLIFLDQSQIGILVACSSWVSIIDCMFKNSELDNKIVKHYITYNTQLKKRGIPNEAKNFKTNVLTPYNQSKYFLIEAIQHSNLYVQKEEKHEIYFILNQEVCYTLIRTVLKLEKKEALKSLEILESIIVGLFINVAADAWKINAENNLYDYYQDTRTKQQIIRLYNLSEKQQSNILQILDTQTNFLFGEKIKYSLITEDEKISKIPKMYIKTNSISDSNSIMNNFNYIIINNVYHVRKIEDGQISFQLMNKDNTYREFIYKSITDFLKVYGHIVEEALLNKTIEKIS